MRAGRGKLPVLAEISGPAPGASRSGRCGGPTSSARRAAGAAGRGAASSWSAASESLAGVRSRLAGAAGAAGRPHGPGRVRPGAAAAGGRPRPRARARACTSTCAGRRPPPEILQPLALAGPAAGGATRAAGLHRRRPPARRPGDPARPRQLPPRDSRSCVAPTSSSSSSARRSTAATARWLAAGAPRRTRLLAAISARGGVGPPAAASCARRSAQACRWRPVGAIVVGVDGARASCSEVVAGEVGVEPLAVLAAGSRRAGRAAVRSRPPARRHRSTPRASATTAITKATIGTT